MHHRRIELGGCGRFGHDALARIPSIRSKAQDVSSPARLQFKHVESFSGQSAFDIISAPILTPRK